MFEPSIRRKKVIARIYKETRERGTLDVLRNGIDHGLDHLDLFCGNPIPGNSEALKQFKENQFSVTRHLYYSLREPHRKLDIVLFINGLPVVTLEFTDTFTKQTLNNTVLFIQNNRDTREKLFEMGRCIAHFAVDDYEAFYSTHLRGKDSQFVPLRNKWTDSPNNITSQECVSISHMLLKEFAVDRLVDNLQNYTQFLSIGTPPLQSR